MLLFFALFHCFSTTKLTAKLQLLIVFSIMINLSCSSQKSDSIEIKYFQSWGGYKIPVKPQYEIELSDLPKYQTYYKAHYRNNLLIRFEKYYKNTLISYGEYQYWDGSKKLKKHTLVNEDGEKRVHNYNKRGKLIED